VLISYGVYREGTVNKNSVQMPIMCTVSSAATLFV